MERSVEFYLGAKWFRDTYVICSCKCGDDGAAVLVDLLAEAEAREASVPTAAKVIAAAEKALRCGKWEHFTPDEREMLADALAAIAKWKEAHNA
jgi:hypothetical protein